MSTTRFCFVRHGETPWNAERRIQGQTDISLNPAGEAQAQGAARWLAAKAKVDALYSSDLQRAWCTAAAIGQALGLTASPEPGLRERRYGLFEGLTYDEAKRDHPDVYAAFDRRDPDYAFPQGGESLVQFHQRVTESLARMVAKHPDQTLVVVLHGGVLDIINRFVRGNPLHTPRDFLIPNAGLNWVVCEAGVWRIEAWGDTSHLQAGALDELPG